MVGGLQGYMQIDWPVRMRWHDLGTDESCGTEDDSAHGMGVEWLYNEFVKASLGVKVEGGFVLDDWGRNYVNYSLNYSFANSWMGLVQICNTISTFNILHGNQIQ